MATFKGQEEYSVDDKGRVAIPAKMRRAMAPEANDTFVMTRGFEKCVFLYPLDRWAEIENDMGKLNPYQVEARAYIRNIMRWADDVVLDKQGRIRLSDKLMEFAGISDRATIIGSFDHIEVWDPATIDAYFNEQADNYEQLAQQVFLGGSSDGPE